MTRITQHDQALLVLRATVAKSAEKIFARQQGEVSRSLRVRLNNVSDGVVSLSACAWRRSGRKRTAAC